MTGSNVARCLNPVKNRVYENQAAVHRLEFELGTLRYQNEQLKNRIDYLESIIIKMHTMMQDDISRLLSIKSTK